MSNYRSITIFSFICLNLILKLLEPYFRLYFSQFGFVEYDRCNIVLSALKYAVRYY